MNFKNKFDDTTKKYYMISGVYGYTGAYYGSKNSYFEEYNDIPLIMYAGKATKYLTRKMNNFILELEELKLEIDHEKKYQVNYQDYLESLIVGCRTAIYKLKYKNEYDVIGIYANHQTEKYFIVDYREAGRFAAEARELHFEVITKQEYEKALMKKKEEENNGKIKYGRKNSNKISVIETIKLLSMPVLCVALMMIITSKLVIWFTTSLHSLFAS